LDESITLLRLAHSYLKAAEFARTTLDSRLVKILVHGRGDRGRIEVVKIPGLREAFSRKKIAKITFEEFENMTGEVLGG